MILDSSVLISMGGPSTEKYHAFEQHVTQRNIAVRIPDLVAEELGESPEAYTYQRERLRAAQKAGWLERAEVDFSNPRVSETVDRTRTRMAKLSADWTPARTKSSETAIGVAFAATSYCHCRFPARFKREASASFGHWKALGFLVDELYHRFGTSQG